MFKELTLKVHFYILCLLSCFPLLGIHITAVLITIFGVLSIIACITAPEKIRKNRWKELVICMLPFTLILIWTVGWDRSSNGFFYLQRSMSLFVFPLAFFILPVQYSIQQKNTFKGLFVLSVLVNCAYGMVGVILKIMPHIGPGEYYKTSSEMFSDPQIAFHVRTFFEKVTGVHPTYASIFLGVAFLLTLDYLLKNHFKWTVIKTGMYSFTLLLIIILQVILAARAPFVGTLLAAFVLFFMQQKNFAYVLWAGFFILILSGALIILIPSFSTRLKEISVKNMIMPTAENNDSFNIRTGIYKCSWNIIKENWLVGVGPGKVQEHLNSCYSDFSKEVYDGKDYNTHNQLLDYWAGMGILAPLALILFLIYVSFSNFRIRNFLPLGLCILFFIAMQTENILIRQNGVVAFSYFLGLFCFSNSNKEETNFSIRRQRIN